MGVGNPDSGLENRRLRGPRIVTFAPVLCIAFALVHRFFLA